MHPKQMNWHPQRVDKGQGYAETIDMLIGIDTLCPASQITTALVTSTVLTEAEFEEESNCRTGIMWDDEHPLSD